MVGYLATQAAVMQENILSVKLTSDRPTVKKTNEQEYIKEKKTDTQTHKHTNKTHKKTKIAL